ncbi:MAG TPA: hypothetical protein VFC63_03695 [Blastocatellia bacterium]|nr:hypothetical protein [Blastocatellia bacterium]
MKTNMRRIYTIGTTMAFVGAIIMSMSASLTRAAEDGPFVIRDTVMIRADRMLRYWKVPNQDDYWSWIPQMSFYIKGNIGTGSKVLVDFTTADGKLWYTTTAVTENYGNPELTQVVVNDVKGHMDERATISTGVFGYKITVRNALSGTNQVLMSGKFKVGKFHVGPDLPANRFKYEYYVDQDWTLPIGYLFLNTKDNASAPALVAGMWFRGNELDNTKLAAYIFYKGEQIGSTKDQSGSAGKYKSILTASPDGDAKWELWTFSWSSVRAYNVDTSANRYPDTHFMDKNPGTYEIKVLRNGKLCRTASFTVGPDGKMVDSGLAAKNNINSYLVIIPVKVLGDQDGKVDLTAWQTQAFYGNPLTGFDVP